MDDELQATVIEMMRKIARQFNARLTDETFYLLVKAGELEKPYVKLIAQERAKAARGTARVIADELKEYARKNLSVTGDEVAWYAVGIHARLQSQESGEPS